MENAEQAPGAFIPQQLAGRRDTLRLLGLSSLGALAGLSQRDHALAENQTRE